MSKSLICMTYKNKNWILLFLIAIIFLMIFSRGIELNLNKSMTERIRVHAIPVAISVLYHHHLHDYTGLRAVEAPFQGPGTISSLITSAISQDVGQDKSIYYWVADDKGFEDYVIAAFYIFGPQVDSLYNLWFVFLLLTIVFYVISFNSERWALAYLCLALLGVHLAVSTLPLSVDHLTSIVPANFVSIYETRFLDVLAIIPIIHMIFFATRRKKPKWIKDILPLIGQLFIFIFLYHSRSSLGWEALSVLLFCMILIITRIYINYKKLTKYKVRLHHAGIGSAIIVAALLFVFLISLSIYKKYQYNEKYFAEMGARTFWHNALMGLGQEDSVFLSKYNLNVNDLMIANSVIKYARDTKKCLPDIEKLEGQVLLDTLGGWGVANWTNYEKCAKSFYFSILNENKARSLYLYTIKKPFLSFHTVISSMMDSDNAEDNSIRKKLGVGWHPLSLINASLFFLVMLMSFNSLYRARVKLILVTLILFICSFIPSVAFYNIVLTLGGVLVTTGVLFYLMLMYPLNWILNLLRQSKHPKKLTGYPLGSKNLTIVIPAFNEENRISLTIKEVYATAKKILDDFEIIVIDDGSTDRTYHFALSEAKECGEKVSVISQASNKGVGAAFHLGLAMAKFPQLCLIPGDNAYHIDGIAELFMHCGFTPLVISYRQNMEARTLLRYYLSRMATLSLRLITGLRVRDAHSLYLFPVEETKKLNVQSDSYGYHIETLSRLLSTMKSFTEVPVTLNPRPDASSGVMKPRTLIILAVTIIRLFWLRLTFRLLQCENDEIK